MFDVIQYAKAAQSIIEAGRFLYGQGWSPATSSNYSARIDREHIAVTVSGKHKGQLEAGDVMVVDLQGTPVQCSTRASAETLLHTALYRLFPDLGAVLHTHSAKATVLSQLIPAGEALVFEDYELQKAFSGQTTHEATVSIPVFDNTQDIESLSRETEAWFARNPDQPGYLIRGHGLYTWGRSMTECLRHVEAFEFLFECELEKRRLK